MICLHSYFDKTQYRAACTLSLILFYSKQRTEIFVLFQTDSEPIWKLMTDLKEQVISQGETKQPSLCKYKQWSFRTLLENYNTASRATVTPVVTYTEKTSAERNNMSGTTIGNEK